MERILIKFTKKNGAKFISHLDTMRTLHRALRRAQLPISYSKGFNPHASISVAAPLSLGIASDAEYADIELDVSIDIDNAKESLNKALPEGIRVTGIIRIGEKMPSAMGTVEGAAYSISMKHNIEKGAVNSIIDSIMSSPEIMKIKKTKSGEKLTDIRPLIKSISMTEYNSSQLEFDCFLSAGSKGSLGPEMVAELLKEKSGGIIFGYPNILRKEIYGMKDGSWTGLDSYFTGK